MAQPHWYCAACGRTEGLTVHHIIGGRGGRSDEPCNLLCLCWNPCHLLAEGLDVRNAGPLAACKDLLLPKITLAVALTMKLETDPEEYDEVRLTILHGRPLPQLFARPHFFLWNFRKNRPEGVTHCHTS